MDLFCKTSLATYLVAIFLTIFGMLLLYLFDNYEIGHDGKVKVAV